MLQRNVNNNVPNDSFEQRIAANASRLNGVADRFTYRGSHILLRAGPVLDCAIAEVLSLFYGRCDAIFLRYRIVTGKIPQ